MRRSVALVLLIVARTAFADVGVVVYESKGVDSRRTNSGHIALIATNLCAEGIDQVRRCSAGEQPGVVMTRYLNLAYGYERSVFVVPLQAHFTAAAVPSLTPALTSDDTLEAMQMAYWRQYLRPYLRPFSQEQYEDIRRKVDGSAGRTLRGLISLETELGALEPKQKKYPTEPIALIDPNTHELIPNGLWREAVGAAHLRSSIRITAPVAIAQEERLIHFVAAVNKEPFQALSDNCSDFVERGLATVFSDSGLRFRPRILNVADAWVTNPLRIATDFVNFTHRRTIPLTVIPVPMIAGTRRPTAGIHSLLRGALVPDPSQGKFMFGLKVALNVANPLLGGSAYILDKASRFTDLKELAHQQAKGSEASRREQVEVFGTSSCWKSKEREFTMLAAQARELELLSSTEQGLLLKPGRPFLLTRQYAEEQGNAAADRIFGVGREEIRKMAESDNRESRVAAFRIMTAVLNYDFSSEPSHRRTAQDFGADWKLFLDVAKQNGLRIPDGDPMLEPLATCSCREFDQGFARQDALADGLTVRRKLARQGREFLFGRAR